MKSLRWIIALIVATAWAAAIASGCRHVEEPPHVAPAPPPVVHVLGYPASPSFYANERSINRYWPTDPTYGAVGDDSHDDAPAWQAAINAAQSTNGMVVAAPPAVAYAINEELVAKGPLRATCDSGYDSHSCILRAHGGVGSQRSVLMIQSQWCPAGGATCAGSAGFPNPETGGGRSYLAHLTFDANFTGAKYALLNYSTANSVYDDVRAINSNSDCIRVPNSQVPYTFSNVTATVPGGSPSAVTVSQPDPLYALNVDSATPPHAVSLTVVTGGALGTATYSTNLDGTGALGALPLEPITYVQDLDLNGVEFPSGIAVVFPSGTYHTGDHYDFTWTQNVPTDASLPFNENQSGNTWNKWTDSQAVNCGSAQFVNTTPFNSIPNIVPDSTAVVGTVSLVANSQIATFSGTTLTAITDASTVRGVLWVSGQTPMRVQSILDDTHVALAQGSFPTATVTNVAFGIGFGGGYYSDGLSQGPFEEFENSFFSLSSVGMSLAGANGHELDHVQIGQCGFAPLIFSDTAGSSSSIVNFLLMEASVSGLGVPLFSPGSSGLWNAPQLFTAPADQSGGNWTQYGAGRITPLVGGTNLSWVPLSTAQLSEFPVFINASTSLTAPTTTAFASGSTSYIRLNALSGDTNWQGNPCVANTHILGTLLLLHNTGSTAIILNDENFVGGTGFELEDATEVLGPGDKVLMVSDSFGYRQISPIGRSTVSGNSGQYGDGSMLTTTTNNTATTIYTVPLGTGGISTTCDVTATSGIGANQGTWKGVTYVYDASGNRVAYSVGLQTGNGSGGIPPNSWALQAPPSTISGSLAIKGIGDNSGNNVKWAVRCRHVDGAQ